MLDSNEQVRRLRLGALVLVGTIGVASRFLPLPTWLLLALPPAAAGVWLATAFQIVKPGETEVLRRQRMRNLAIACALGGLVALFYVGTMIRLGPNVFNRPI
jgi:hypothetical protein